MLLLQAGLPVPAYPTLIVTGALAARGGYSLPDSLPPAVVASLVADLVWYRGGPPLRQPRAADAVPHFAVAGFVRAPDRIDLHALGRPRRWPSPSSFPASRRSRRRWRASSGCRCGRFIAFDAIGAALWSGVAIGLGYIFRDAIDDVLDVLETLGKIGLVLLIVGAFVLYVAGNGGSASVFIRQLRMDRMTVDELRELIDEGKRVGKIIDVRSPMSQAVTGRIPGAITVDMQEHASSTCSPSSRERSGRLLRVSRTRRRR